nr:hypothetical protein Iba_chr06aCG2710 [Ipomoea batatas]GMD04821.1 hypothetical protein Iba_chr06bCG0740 [Ipomoea batatas]GMD08845.1 hypothetical protein Iba_chr06dCG2450 [Ipomoea batatas]GMD11259.1 hypothetical protein Iba_chr06fCG2030 [Ipomoea batatas]GME16190.1 hypothetical protein Iba_scaffold17159.3CG0390 [Ipomoea batatas]
MGHILQEYLCLRLINYPRTIWLVIVRLIYLNTSPRTLILMLRLLTCWTHHHHL